MLTKGVLMWAYYYIYENWKIYELPWNSLFTWVVAALLTDLGYYWVHRAAHGIMLLHTNVFVSIKLNLFLLLF